MALQEGVHAAAACRAGAGLVVPGLATPCATALVALGLLIAVPVSAVPVVLAEFEDYFVASGSNPLSLSAVVLEGSVEDFVPSVVDVGESY